MKEKKEQHTGYFVFSLDTELASGYFDLDKQRKNIFSTDGSRERRAIIRVLDMLDEYNINATWAIVGHIMYAQCEKCNVCPILEWKGKYQSFNEVYGTENPLWYGADIVNEIIKRSPRHEIAFHGYTHQMFDESLMSVERAKFEISEWRRIAKRWNIEPFTVIFPRDRTGYLKLFQEAGFISYRTDIRGSIYTRNKYFNKLIKAIDHVLSISIPPFYSFEELANDGMVNIKESQHLFGYNRRIELFLDSLNLHKQRIKRIIKGVKKAAEEKKIIHIWAHPWEFRTEKDFKKLRFIFENVALEIEKGKMQSITMVELAKKVKAEYKSQSQ